MWVILWHDEPDDAAELDKVNVVGPFQSYEEASEWAVKAPQFEGDALYEVREMVKPV